MRSGELYRRFVDDLSPSQQRYAIGWLMGDIGMEVEGFTNSKDRPNHEHAKYLEDRFANAIAEAVKNDPSPKTSATESPQFPPQRMTFTVGDILRCRAFRGGFRVWQVTAVLLGGVSQENVITLRTLDCDHGIGGEELSVPEEMLLVAISNGMEILSA